MMYKHGISFKNPQAMPIPITARTPEFIAFTSLPSSKMWSKRMPVWEEEKQMFIPKGGVDMLGSLGQPRIRSWMRSIKPIASRVATESRPYRYGAITAMLPAAAKKERLTWAKAAGTSFSPYERRYYKRSFARRLGTKTMEVPSFSEFALGEITVNTGGSAVRSVTGFLQNLLTTGAEAYKVQQETKLAKVQAQIQAGEAAMMQAARGTIESPKFPYMLGIGGAVLLGAMMYLKKKGKR